MEKSIWDKTGAFLIGIITRWTFKVLSGFLLALGINYETWELWLTAAITFIIGALITKSQNDYLRNK